MCLFGWVCLCVHVFVCKYAICTCVCEREKSEGQNDWITWQIYFLVIWGVSRLFHRGRGNVHSHQPCRSFLFICPCQYLLPSFFDVWYSPGYEIHIVLIHISLIFSNLGHRFYYLFVIWISSSVASPNRSPSHLLIALFCFLLLLQSSMSSLYSLVISLLWDFMACKYFLIIHQMSFCFSDVQKHSQFDVASLV